MSCWEIFCPRRFPSLGFLLGSGDGHMPSIYVSPNLDSMRTLWSFPSYWTGIVCRSSLFSASSSLSISISAGSFSFICIVVSPPSSKFFPRTVATRESLCMTFSRTGSGACFSFPFSLCRSADLWGFLTSSSPESKMFLLNFFRPPF